MVVEAYYWGPLIFDKSSTNMYYMYTMTPAGIEALQCTADVIKEIPRLERVAPAMLISAQSCVARSLEETW